MRMLASLCRVLDRILAWLTTAAVLLMTVYGTYSLMEIWTVK